MYSQSVGPLNKNDKKVLDNYINEFDCFMVRDDESYKNVSQYKNILQTNDAAFLLDLIYKDTNIEYKRVAISVREWGHDGRSAEHYKNLIKSLVYKCIDNNFEVEFISTCQGLENYVDDSKIALEIYNEIEMNIAEISYVEDCLREYIEDGSYFEINQIKNSYDEENTYFLLSAQ